MKLKWIGKAKDFNLVHIEVMKIQKLIYFHLGSISYPFP